MQLCARSCVSGHRRVRFEVHLHDNGTLMTFSLHVVSTVAVISAPVEARPVAARRAASTDDLASLLDTSRVKPLDAAEDKILPRGGNDFLGMTGKALEEAGSTLREPSRFHTPTASAGQQPTRAPYAMDSSLHLSDLFSGSPHAPLRDGTGSSSSAVAPVQSPAKLKRKREPRAAAARATNAQPQDIPPELERHIRNDKEREQFLSKQTRELVWIRLYNRERRATRESWTPPAVLTPKQQSLRDSSLATALDREDFDSKDGKRFWLAYQRVDYREREAKNMSPEERAVFAANVASDNPRQRPRVRISRLTESQKALQRSEFFKPEDQAELDLQDTERSRRVWKRVRRRSSSAAQRGKERQAQESNRRAEVPKDLIDVQSASTLALTAPHDQAPLRVSQAQPKSSKPVRVDSQDLLSSPGHSSESDVRNALPDSDVTRRSSHLRVPSPGEKGSEVGTFRLTGKSARRKGSEHGTFRLTGKCARQQRKQIEAKTSFHRALTSRQLTARPYIHRLNL